MLTYAIDFETFYSKQVSVTTLGMDAYLAHPLCDIYMVGIYSQEGEYAYVGPPAQADWVRLNGQHLVAHNSAFDKACFDRLQREGVIPADIQCEWDCTADLSVFLGAGRSLKEAAHTLLGLDISKQVRADMKGKTYMDAQLEGMADDLGKYCLGDAKLSYLLWANYAARWPEWERQLSRHTRAMCRHGVAIDREALDKGLQTLGEVMADALQRLPWADTAPPLSPAALRKECAKVGIPAPKSLAEDSEDCAAWEADYGARVPWVAGMRDFRKSNTLHKKLKTMESRLTPEGTFPFGLKYFGAHTGRWSGDAGYNVQNLPRVEMYGVDLRAMIVPRPGHVFVVSDLGQIEQRVLSWLAGDNRMMEVLATGVSVYEAHARATMGWTGGELKHENPGLYRLAKSRVLGLGYGAGASVFVKIAKIMAGLDISPSQAEQVVAEFRRTNPLILDLWRKLDNAFRAHEGKDFELPLPSGRSLVYRGIRKAPKGYSAEVQGKRVSFFGGKLAENLTSATARDVLGFIILRLESAGYKVVMHVHDEVVVEVPVEQAGTAKDAIHALMTENPPWLEGLPLTAETFVTDHYTK